MLLPVIKLKTPRNSRHPWIYKKMVQAPRGIDLEAGSLVEVRDKGGAFVGRAFYHPENTIAIRLLTERKDEDIDETFLHDRLATAKRLRDDVVAPESGDCFRLVHAEADGLPGLVIDKFADVLLVEPYVAGWLHMMEPLAGALRRLFPECRVAVRADDNAEVKEGVSFARLEKRYAPPETVDIMENGIRYRVDFRSGHKTGFFLDQRENRALVGRLARGRDVLDLCCYTGGFALSAWRGGAKRVTAVDLDERAVEAAGVNVGLNGAGGVVECVHGDAFAVARERTGGGRRHDMVVLDPPKLAGGQDDVERALGVYYDMNRAALGVVSGGGYFVTFSCSGAVSGERWRQVVRRAAADMGRGLVMFWEGGAGVDHPVAGDFPQGRYLKSLFARVD